MKTADEILKSHDKFYINLGLKRIKLILSLIGNPQKEFKIIHVGLLPFKPLNSHQEY